MEQKKRILISAIILVALIAVFYLVTSGITKYTGFLISENSNDELGECLSLQSLVLYINLENSDEALKKTGLIQYMEYFKIQNCFTNNQPCLEEGVTYSPTWIINNNKVVGDITESELAEYSGCNTK